jgi:hypothetical protein
MVVELMQLAGVFNIGDFVPALRWLDPQGVVAKMKRLHRRYDAMMDGFISERDQRPHQALADGEGKDLLSVMLGMMRPDGAGGEEEGITFNHTDIKALLLVSSQVFTCVHNRHVFICLYVWSIYVSCISDFLMFTSGFGKKMHFKKI